MPTDLFHHRYHHFSPLILSGNMDTLSGWLAWFTVELARLKHKAGKNFCFSPPTGGTPARLYQLLGTMVGESAFRSDDQLLALDNYWLPSGHPSGYDTEIQQVMTTWGMDSEQLITLPYAEDADRQSELLSDFDTMLETFELDVQGLGIGDDGHIGFRLRPRKPTDRDLLITRGTELVSLDDTVRAANARYFDNNLDSVPKFALTRGLKSILPARWVWIMANTIVKANPIFTAFTGAVGEHCPASYLQLHPRVIVLLCDDAAGPFEGDPRVRRHMPNIADLLASESVAHFCQRF